MTRGDRGLSAELHRHRPRSTRASPAAPARAAPAARRRSSCSATISSFGTAADCRTRPTPARPRDRLSSTQACTTPTGWAACSATIYGIQAGAFTPTLTGSCAPQGTPRRPGPPPGRRPTASARRRWSAAGCADGAGLRARSTSGAKCVMWDGPHACPAATTPTYWYTGFTDTRTCGACTCGAPDRTELLRDAHPASAPTTPARRTSPPRCRAASATATRATASTRPGIVFTGTPTQPTCPGSVADRAAR